MSQIWDIDLISATGTSPATDITRIVDGFNSLKSIFSGPAEPAAADQVPYMLWADTQNGVLKQRNAGNTAWVPLGPLAGLWSAGRQVFTGNGTFTVPAWVSTIYVSGCAGGGGGGNGASGTSGNGSAGGGGGAGQSILKQAYSVTPGQAIAITIGAGGAAQSAGGNTVIGALATLAGGGAGAVGANINGYSPGGGGGSGYPVGGDANDVGNNTAGGGSGSGGSSPFGGGGNTTRNGATSAANGKNGQGYGSGGSGGGGYYIAGAGTAGTGGAGAPGIVIIEW